MNTTQTTTADDLMNYIDDLAFDLASQKPYQPGFYVLGDQGYLVKWNKAGTYLYAERSVEGRFEYDRGAIHKLTVGDRLTAEQAEAMSLRVGYCVICGRTLTVKVSVERGMGPVCRKRYYPA